MKKRWWCKGIIVVSLGVFATFGCAHGESDSAGTAEPTEQAQVDRGSGGMDDSARREPASMKMDARRHKQMAEMHEKIAECLESGKSQQDCMQVMRENCPMADKGHQCPMMSGMMGSGH